MNHFWQLVYEHRFSIGTGAWYVVSGLIVTMPPKGEPLSFRDWFYDFTHLLLNLKPVPGITQPKQPSNTN